MTYDLKSIVLSRRYGPTIRFTFNQTGLTIWETDGIPLTGLGCEMLAAVLKFIQLSYDHRVNGGIRPEPPENFQSVVFTFSDGDVTVSVDETGIMKSTDDSPMFIYWVDSWCVIDAAGSPKSDIELEIADLLTLAKKETIALFMSSVRQVFPQISNFHIKEHSLEIVEDDNHTPFSIGYMSPVVIRVLELCLMIARSVQHEGRLYFIVEPFIGMSWRISTVIARMLQLHYQTHPRLRCTLSYSRNVPSSVDLFTGSDSTMMPHNAGDNVIEFAPRSVDLG